MTSKEVPGATRRMIRRSLSAAGLIALLLPGSQALASELLFNPPAGSSEQAPQPRDQHSEPAPPPPSGSPSGSGSVSSGGADCSSPPPPAYPDGAYRDVPAPAPASCPPPPSEPQAPIASDSSAGVPNQTPPAHPAAPSEAQSTNYPSSPSPAEQSTAPAAPSEPSDPQTSPVSVPVPVITFGDGGGGFTAGPPPPIDTNSELATQKSAASWPLTILVAAVLLTAGPIIRFIRSSGQKIARRP